MVYIGIDLGGTSVKVGLVDESGKILVKESCPTLVERGAEPVINDMANLSLKVIEKAGYTLDDVKAIGIGLPGIQDPRTGRVPFCTNLHWFDVDVIGIMKKTIDKPIFIGNDATVAGLAESVAGVSAGVSHSVFLTLGTGVGGGVVIDGKVWSGVNGVGSEIGHMITVLDGEECTCGNKGCWERYASATAIIRMGKAAAKENPDCAIMKSVNGDLDAITAKTVIDAAKAGDETAVKVFDNYVYHLCAGLVNIINFMDPDFIVLGGGVSHAGQFLLDAIRAKLPSMIFYKTMPYARIELAVLGNDAGIIGAAMLGK
ncbi:MAG: ROK family protein [Clostridia bacterium]|nr:ROK family protein [Clostridia bacterium]